MIVHRIVVEPVEDRWAVRKIGQDGFRTYVTGAEAERAARALGERLAADGAFAHLKVMLKDGKVAGRYVYVPKGDGPSRAADQALMAAAG